MEPKQSGKHQKQLKEDQVGKPSLPDNKIYFIAIFYSRWNRILVMQGKTDSVMEEKTVILRNRLTIYKPDRGHGKSVG